jgi:hypothetical protein
MSRTGGKQTLASADEPIRNETRQKAGRASDYERREQHPREKPLVAIDVGCTVTKRICYQQKQKNRQRHDRGDDASPSVARTHVAATVILACHLVRLGSARMTAMGGKRTPSSGHGRAGVCANKANISRCHRHLSCSGLPTDIYADVARECRRNRTASMMLHWL